MTGSTGSSTPRTAKVLARALDLHTVGDLLRHYPRRYEQRGELTDLASLRDGEHVTVLAQISAVTSRPMKNRRGKLTEVTVTDGHGTLTLAFFRQPWREKEMKPGLHGLFAGQVSTYGRKRQLIHPDCELLGQARTRAPSWPPSTRPRSSRSTRRPARWRHGRSPRRSGPCWTRWTSPRTRCPRRSANRYGLQASWPRGTASTARWSSPRSSRPGCG